MEVVFGCLMQKGVSGTGQWSGGSPGPQGVGPGAWDQRHEGAEHCQASCEAV